MSAGYASRLSPYPNKGVCGLPESTDSTRSLSIKLRRLTNLVKNAKHMVVLTGAGISTSAGIPDFRGPKGIWTLEIANEEKEKNRRKRQRRTKNQHARDKDEDNASSANTTTADTSPVDITDSDETGYKENEIGDHEQPKRTNLMASSYQPTLTHRAIGHLISHNIIQLCITQNVDGLHRRTGIPRSKLSILHGCLFTEKCEKCHTEYFRDFDIGGVSFQKTGRKCTNQSCMGCLRDTVLDWDDELPEDEFHKAQIECYKSDLVLCLGTSLRIQPAASLPTLAKKYVIVNLQVTPYDDKAELIIRAKVDFVMNNLMKALNFEDWDISTGTSRIVCYDDVETA